MLHPQVGTTIDSTENAKFHIIPQIRGFRQAVIRHLHDSVYTVQVRRRDANGNSEDTVIEMPKRLLLRMAERIQHHDAILEGAYVLGTEPLEDFPDSTALQHPSGGVIAAITLKSGHTVDGRLIAVRDSSLVLLPAPLQETFHSSQGMRVLRRRDISSIRLSRESHVLEYEFKGFAGGAIIGLGIGAIALGVAGDRTDVPLIGVFAVTTVLTALPGLVGGLIAGLIASSDQVIDPALDTAWFAMKTHAKFPAKEAAYIANLH